MSDGREPRSQESRWLPALTILAVLFVLYALPGRIRVVPSSITYFAAITLLVPMTAATFAPTSALWVRVERITTFLFFVFGTLANLYVVTRLIDALISHPEIGGIELLASSIALWINNVLIFSLLYWQLDRGGPVARADSLRVMPDWRFPEAGPTDDVPSGWRPSFLDYLFLGYTTATTFSASYALPLTPRAKALMMIQSTIALVTIVLVASRAINILK